MAEGFQSLDGMLICRGSSQHETRHHGSRWKDLLGIHKEVLRCIDNNVLSQLIRDPYWKTSPRKTQGYGLNHTTKNGMVPCHKRQKQ